MVERSIHAVRTRSGHRRRSTALALAVLAGSTCAATVAAPAQAAALPNLVVTGITWTTSAGSATPTTGTPVTFSATIENTGSAPTPSGVIHGVQFRVDGNMVTWADASTASLAPGRSRTVTATGGPTGSSTWVATAGTHRINAMVDDAKRIVESQEHDNTFDAPPLTVRAATGSVSSTVVTRGGGLFVDSTIGPSTVQTTVNSRVTGQLSGACFTSTGAVIKGSGKGFGTFQFGDPALGPGNDPSAHPFAVAAPNSTQQTVSAAVQMSAVRRDVAAYLDRIPCPVNGTAGLYQFRAQRVESARLDMTGTSGRLSTTSASAGTVYAFAPPTTPALTSTLSTGTDEFAVHSTFRAPTQRSWMASAVTGESYVACFAKGVAVAGTVTRFWQDGLGNTDAGVGGNGEFYPWGFVDAGTTTREGGVGFVLLRKNFSQQQAFDPMACPAGSSGGLYAFRATRLDTALHGWMDNPAVTVRYSTPVDVTFRF